MREDLPPASGSFRCASTPAAKAGCAWLLRFILMTTRRLVVQEARFMLMLFLMFEEVVDLPTWFVFIGSARVSGKEMRLQGGICRWPITWAQALFVRPAGWVRRVTHAPYSPGSKPEW